MARWWAPLLFALAAIVVTVDVPYTNGPPIRSDGLGYHAWTRALLDGHLSFCDYNELQSVQGVTDPIPATGRCANKYPPGLAVLRFPIMAPFTAANHGALRSSAEDAVDQWFSVVAGIIAVLATVATLVRMGATRLRANGAAFAVAFGTGLFHYATYDSSFTHVYTAAFVALLLLLATYYDERVQSGDRPSRRLIAGLAVCAGVMVSIRQPLILVVGGLVSAWLLRAVQVIGWRRAVARDRSAITAISIACAAALSVQLTYNRYVFGKFTISSYANEKFSLHDRHQLDVVFSINKGIIVWYPVVLVALVLAVARRRWFSVLLVLATTVPLVLLYGAWHAWDLAGGFGHRGFVELAPVYAVALAGGLDTRHRWVRIAGWTAVALCVLMTLGLMRAYWSGEIGFNGTEYAAWKHYGWARANFASETLDWIAAKIGG